MNNFQPNNTSATFALSSAAKMMMPDYEMYKIHRQGQQLNGANGSDHQKKLTKKKSKGALEDDDEDEKTKCKVATIRIEDHDEEEEKRKMERKKRTQEDMVADFVKILEQMKEECVWMAKTIQREQLINIIRLFDKKFGLLKRFQ